MKTKLQQTLAKIAPSLNIETDWSHDLDCSDIRKECDGFDDENPEDWQAWKSEIKVSAIVEGEIVTASAYLGGTWEKAGDLPEETNPDISGYEPQMTVEALEGLLAEISNDGGKLGAEIYAAIAHINSSDE